MLVWLELKPAISGTGGGRMTRMGSVISDEGRSASALASLQSFIGPMYTMALNILLSSCVELGLS